MLCYFIFGCTAKLFPYSDIILFHVLLTYKLIKSI